MTHASHYLANKILASQNNADPFSKGLTRPDLAGRNFSVKGLAIQCSIYETMIKLYSRIPQAQQCANKSSFFGFIGFLSTEKVVVQNCKKKKIK